MTVLDDLWAELLFDACASDGPIRDRDVRNAIIHYRPRIEAEAAHFDIERLAMAMHRVRNHNGSDELHVLVPHPHSLDTALAEAILVEYNSPEEE